MIAIPKGFVFAAARAGFKRPDRLDLSLFLSETPAVAAAVYTMNLFTAAPVIVGREITKAGGTVRAIVCNTGQANASTGEAGLADCRSVQRLIARNFDLKPAEVLPASTGVIGVRLKLDKFEAAMPELVASKGHTQATDAAKAMMTTDSFPKMVWREIAVDGKTVSVLGFAKGAGMISPNMATMLSFILTDADVDPVWWQETLALAVEHSFNRVTVDGDTSTNDTVYALANGASHVRFGADNGDALALALTEVCSNLAYMIIQDAEGGTKVLHINVQGAVSDAEAELAARAIGTSPLVKTAAFGSDPNWGRIVAALGRSGANFDPQDVSVDIGGVSIFAKGEPEAIDVDAVFAPIMRRKDIVIDVKLGDGPGSSYVLASDLTYDYVKINADYRT